ncbi:MAG: type II toxin-antitoxin system ParD family antitoxin [Gemmatales bacterium]
MDALNVSLPKAMKEYVQERVKTGGYGNTSEYVRDLIRAEQKQRAKAELEALIMEGINSGPAHEVNDEFWAGLKERVTQRTKQRKKSS